MKRYGLVFKTGDQCWLAEYNDGVVEDAVPIDDNEGFYTDMNPREMVLVSIRTEGTIEEGERVFLQDLKSITVENEDDPEKCIVDLIDSGAFPEVAQNIFELESNSEENDEDELDED